MSIPKIIHQITGSGTNELIEKCFNSWRALEKLGFKIIMWNDSTLVTFLKTHHDFAFEAFMNSRNHAEAADIARYLLIYTFGGHYVDWDIELIDEIKFQHLNTKYSSGYMLLDHSNNTLASEYFCAVVGDEFLLNITKDIVEIYESGMRKLFMTPQYSGPYRMRDCLSKYPKTLMATIPIKEAFVYDYQEIRNMPDKVIAQPMIHYWLHSWFE